MKHILFIILTLFVLAGCKTTEKIVEVEKIKYKDRVETVHDSVFVQDSIVREIKTKGDTVYNTLIKWKTLTTVKNVYIKDSIRDTIPVVVEVVKYKKSKNSLYLICFVIVILITLFFIGLYSRLRK